MKNIPVILITAMLLTSCASFKTIFREPEVSFDSASVSGIDFESAGFVFRYRVENPNAVSLELARFQYSLFVEDKLFISGTSAGPLSIAKESESFVDIPVDIVYRELYELLKDLFTKDSASYRIEAEFTFNLPVFGKAVFPVKYEGFVPLLKVPDITFEKLRIVSLSPFSANLEFLLKITNKNSFAISPDSFNFDLSVNKDQWLRGILKNIGEMAPGKSVTAKIPVEVNPAKIGTEIFDFIFKGIPLDIVLSGNMQIRTSYPGFNSADIPFSIEKNATAAK